mgnify:CR=1 FL=1
MSHLNLISLCGWFALCGIAWLLGGCKRPLPWRTVAGSAILTFGLGAVVFLLPFSRRVLEVLNDIVLALLSSASRGAEFLLGPLAVGPGQTTASGEPSIGFVLAAQVLPAVIFFAALMGLLHHLGVIEPVVRFFGRIFHRTLELSGAEALAGSMHMFFGVETARQMVAEGNSADLLLGNNVLAQVPDLNDFVAGMKILLKPAGVVTMEFPHLMRMMAENQFDTIYHEHFGYFSFLTAVKIFAAHGLTMFDVEELSTHGGSLRIYARHDEDESKPVGDRVREMLFRETDAGFTTLDRYSHFDAQVKETKRKLLDFLIQAKREGKSVVGYGAPGKGNTLLNYCGIRTDFLDYTVDRSPHKQGKFLPGTHIPIHHPDRIRETRPDYLLILPWNLKNEIMEQMAGIREWGGKFVVPIPEARVYE